MNGCLFAYLCMEVSMYVFMSRAIYIHAGVKEII